MDQLPYFIVIALGAICLLLGFFIIVRGIGVAESVGTFKFLGFEVSTSKVGPGILFAMFGVLLISLAMVRLPAPSNIAPYDPNGPKRSEAPERETVAEAQIASASPAPPMPANKAETLETGLPGPGPAPAPPAQIAESPMTAAASPVAREDASAAASGTQKAEAIKNALNRTAAGDCPGDLMAERLLQACRQQVAWMGPKLAAAGPVRSVAYSGRSGEYEAYNVNYEGQTVEWWAVFNSANKLVAFLPAQSGR